jgi:hypothetical protein
MQGDKPVDLVSQPAAAKLIGRSVETVRRWRKSGKLRSWREEGATAPVMISKAEIWNLAGIDKVTPTYPKHVTPKTPLEVELRESRDYFRSRTEILENELRHTQNKLADKERRIAALERELASREQELMSPVKALLGVGRRKFFGGNI